MNKAVSYLFIGCLMLMGAASAPVSTPVEAAASMALISGTVNDDAGKPLAGAVVALFTAPTGSFLGGNLIKSMTTDAEGKFRANVIPGIYRLRAVADGFRPTFTLIELDVANRITHNFSLRRTGTLIEKRGDKADYRWIGRSVPRTVMHYHDEGEFEEPVIGEDKAPHVEESFHGVVQLTSLSGSESSFTGTNFAVSTTFGKGIETAFIGQTGFGVGAPQRFATFVSARPAERHQLNASAAYGRAAMRDPSGRRTLEQFSFGATDSWQLSKPILLIFGFDYSTFGAMGKGEDSILPRVSVQYSPNSRSRLSAAISPGGAENRQSLEGVSSESIRARFDSEAQEFAFGSRGAVPDRSRRIETGFERLLGASRNSSMEASAFYDIVSGHGVGFLALPLEASPETQDAMQQVARQVVAMNGAARGVRIMYSHRFSDYLSASAGYSIGRGQRLNGQAIDEISPARMFTGGNFQVASGKVDLDFTSRTGTRISTVVRLSPSAVVFAIDPFAGRMSVYDPNVSIYITQSLPSFGLPGKMQALVDLRNLFDQMNGVNADRNQLLVARTQRSVRGAISFQW